MPIINVDQDKTKTRAELRDADSSDSAIADLLGKLADSELIGGVALVSPENRELCLTAWERILWLSERVRGFEEYLGLDKFSNGQVRTVLHQHREKAETLGNVLLKYDLQEGDEPQPYIEMGGRRFVNMDWVNWSTNVHEAMHGTPVTRHSQMEEAARRAVRLLFPTPESIKGVQWHVNTLETPRENSWTKEVTAPGEIVIDRAFKERI